MSTKTRTQMIEDIRVEIAAHVKFLERGNKPLSFQKDLLDVREQARQNARDCPHDPELRERLVLLDAICAEENVA